MALSVVEKVIFLQNVDVFARVPSEQLSYVGAIASDTTVLEGDTIYNLGDESDALYVVIEGSVRLHIEDEDITIAKDGDAFGAWALLDDQPRVTNATATADTRLLRVDRDDFIELLADHSEITQSVFKTVVGRMRNLLGRVGEGNPRRS